MENNAKRKRIIKSNTKKGKSAQILGTHQQFSAMDSDDSDSDTVSGGDDDDDDEVSKLMMRRKWQSWHLILILISSAYRQDCSCRHGTSNRMAEDKDRGKDGDNEKKGEKEGNLSDSHHEMLMVKT